MSLLPARAEPRLAILADDSALPVTDLLAARLSEQKELTLMERTELDKVMREANLPARGNL